MTSINRERTPVSSCYTKECPQCHQNKIYKCHNSQQHSQQYSQSSQLSTKGEGGNITPPRNGGGKKGVLGGRGREKQEKRKVIFSFQSKLILFYKMLLS